MRTQAVVAVLVVSLAASCSGDEEPRRQQSSTGPLADVVPVERLLDVDPATLPVLRTHLPRGVPREGADLPSVLEDPPGRAFATYHPPETWFEGPEGWATEDILFYGEDGDWRRLRMEDLGLPDSAWFADTYGPGTLSPDGRWWIAPSGLGVILLDLSTAEWKVLELDGTMSQGELEWVPGEAAFIAMTYSGPRDQAFEVSVPDGRTAPIPFLPHQVGYEPDGTPVSMQNVGAGQSRLVEWAGRRRIERVVVPMRLPGRGSGPVGVQATAGQLAITVSRQADNHNRNVITVIDSHTGEIRARLGHRQRRVPIEAYPGWLDSDTLLLKTRTHVLAWRPDEQQLYRVMEVPEGPEDLYWTVDLIAAP